MWDRERGLRRPDRLQLALIAVVGASGGLVTVYARAPPVVVLAVTGLALLLGVALTAYLTWIAPSSGGRRERREF